jgi:thymidine phosphorylase
MDVKVGSGAFLPDRESAQELARAIVEVAQGNGLPTSALLTDMDRVLGRTAGNAVEVRESIDHLTGAKSDERLRAITLALCEELLALGGIDGADPARALDSGAAAEHFARMVAELGGPQDILERDPLPHAPVTVEAFPDEAGIIERVDVRAVGVAIIGLGGGRARETDSIDHAVGLTEVAAPGERVGAGERPLAIVHARDAASARRAVSALNAACVVGDRAPEPPPPVLEVIR